MNSLKEIWRPVVGYEDLFEVSTRGRVRSKKTGKIKIASKGAGGYVKIKITKNYSQRLLSVHRLVAEAFLEKPDGKNEVNHKDGDKTNNCADNLEWVTKSENMNHAYRTGLQRTTRNGKVKSVVCLNDGKFFGTISEASEYYGVSKSQIYWCCRRESSKCKVRFRYGEREGE